MTPLSITGFIGKGLLVAAFLLLTVLPLVDFLERLDMSGLDLTREADAGRDIEL